jgi:hypothetical protein
MCTCQVVATTKTIAKMAHRTWARQEARVGEWLGVGIAIVSSCLGETAVTTAARASLTLSVKSQATRAS